MSIGKVNARALLTLMQVIAPLNAGLSHLKLVDIEINVVLSASFQPKRQCSGQECIEVI